MTLDHRAQAFSLFSIEKSSSSATGRAIRSRSKFGKVNTRKALIVFSSMLSSIGVASRSSACMEKADSSAV